MSEAFFDWLRARGVALSAQQRAAVETTEGPQLLVATPGSGKTTVVVCRTAYLLRERRVPAERILTLTFGKQSQLDMDRRFAALFPDMEKPRFSTIHALCLEILRRYSNVSGRPMFALRQDCAAIVKGLLQEQTEGFVDEELMQDAQAMLDCVCNKMLSADEIKSIKKEKYDVAKLCADYARIKREKRIMDFNDLLTFAHRALQVVPQLLQEYKSRYDYIQIDEAQDTSLVQQRMADMLAGSGGNLFLVGDEDQSIYSFRGAAPDYLMQFESAHPGAKVLFMETNYRSGKAIVAAGSRVIQYNANRRQKHMQAHKKTEGVVEQVSLRDWNAQAAEVVRRAKELPKNKTLGVLYRNNDSLLALTDALVRADVPFHVSKKDGKPAIFSHASLRQLKSGIKLCFAPDNGEAYYDLRNRIWRKTPLHIAKQVRDSGNNVFEELEARLGLGRSDAEALEAKRRKLDSYRTMRAYPAVCGLIDALHLDGYGRETQKSRALMTLAMGVENLDGFLAKMNELEVLFDSEMPEGGNVYLSTIHAAKGLEYDEVILVDGRMGVLPAKSLSGETEVDEEEETRLMYVAVTRARERFTYLTASTYHGEQAAAGEYLERVIPPLRMKKKDAPASAAKVNRGTVEKKLAKAKQSKQDYSAWEGKTIRHKYFGDGVIEKVHGGIGDIRFGGQLRALDMRTCVDGGVITILADT